MYKHQYTFGATGNWSKDYTSEVQVGPVQGPMVQVIWSKDCACGFFMVLEIILTELQPFKLVILAGFFCTIGYNILLLQFLKDVGSIMKICIWLFNIDKINFDNYGHLNLVILSSSPHYI